MILLHSRTCSEGSVEGSAAEKSAAMSRNNVNHPALCSRALACTLERRTLPLSVGRSVFLCARTRVCGLLLPVFYFREVA